VSVNFGLVPWVAPPWPGACQISGPGDAEAREFYARARMPVFIWASLAFGFFADAYDPRAPRASLRSRWITRVFGSPANHARLERVREYARQRGLTAAQVALAFNLDQPFPTHCIVGCSSRAKLADCVAALDVHLEPDAVASFLGDQAGPVTEGHP
jgi:aryl-alcohol dehydrogenase-like predicted oxidoreductase